MEQSTWKMLVQLQVCDLLKHFIKREDHAEKKN